MKAMIRGGALIAAIKALRARYGAELGLKAAKDICDAYLHDFQVRGGKQAMEPAKVPLASPDRW